MAPPLNFELTGVTTTMIFSSLFAYTISNMSILSFWNKSTNSLLLFLSRLVVFKSIWQVLLFSFLLSRMRTTEILFGKYRYASIVFMFIILNLPMKIALFQVSLCAQGPFFLLSSLVILYLKFTPSVSSDSITLFSNYRISCKLIVLLALILCVLLGRSAALVEAILGSLTALFICPSSSKPTPLLSCPPFFVDMIMSIWSKPQEQVQTPAVEEEIVVDEVMVEQLMMMGFAIDECRNVLKVTKNDVSAAANILLG